MSSSDQNTTQSVRAKSDIAWGHVVEGRNSKGNKTLTCIHCGKINLGGGINRMKQHLAGRKGDTNSCPKVPYDVSYQMQEALKEIELKNKEKNEVRKHANPFGASVHQFEGDMLNEDCEEMPPPCDEGMPMNEGASGNKKRGGSKMANSAKRNAPIGIGDYFAPRTTPGSQPSLKSCLASKEVIRRVDMAFARFFYDTCIPINAVNSIYLQPLVDAISAVGAGYKHPTYHALRVNLLRDAKKEVQLLVESYKSGWADFGCTLMADGWTDNSQRSLINFLVYCPKGVCFLKSVDASDVVKDARMLCNLFEEMVLWIGPSNIVHIVTDNGANYKAAGRLLCEKYDTITWSPCAAHCLNLILKDIAEMGHIVSLAKRASQVTKFVYNHTILIAWLRKRQGWREIVRPGATRFATTFIALRSLHEHKHDLQAMVTDQFFVESRYAKIKKGKDVIPIILDNKFWDDIGIIVQIVAPLTRLLRIVDSDEKPAIGYVYEGMRRARLGIKMLFKNKKRLYKPYTSIIKVRWDRMLRKDIHAVAYYLNPAFQYEPSTFCNKAEVQKGFLDCVEKKSSVSTSKLVEESRIFRDREGSFSRQVAFQTCKTTRPDEWWRTYGYSTPNLQKFAIKILSQTSASSGCERNWSVFERIHTKKRNRLEHQRLNDLVYVHYNLRLQNRRCYKKWNYDPIDYESIDKTEFWVVDEEEAGELDYDELEKMLYGEGSIPSGVSDECTNGVEQDYQCHISLEDDDESDDDVEVLVPRSFGEANLGSSSTSVGNEDNQY